MRNINRQQKSFILILISYFIVCVLFSLSMFELRSTNRAYAQEYNVIDEQSVISDNLDDSYLELYNEDGSMQMVPEPDNLQNDNTSLIAPVAAPSFNERKLRDSGKPDSESIVVTIMGDGFTASQQSNFIDMANDAVDRMLGNSARGIVGCYPFNLFSDYFTVYAIEVISNQSGVSRDASFNNGVVVDNYFGSSFYYGNNTSTIERALVITNYSRAEQLEKPNSTMTAIICNSTRWGGTGGEFAVLSCATNYETIMFHEFGHSFGGLADEYYYPSDGAFSGREAPNMTSNNNRNTIKWRQQLGVDGVDIYPYSQGVDTTDPEFDATSNSWFKPHTNCKMQYSNQDFCPVCSTELIRKLEYISDYVPVPLYYKENGISVAIENKSGGKWQLYLRNDTGETKSFIYNAKMCFDNDAINWTGLTDIERTNELADGEETQIEISENYFATSIAISYIKGSKRYILYANNLNTDGSMSSYGTSKSYSSYTRNNMKVDLIGKNGSNWLVKLTNNTGSGRTFYYTTTMCFEGDAQNWTGLSNIGQVYLANGATTSEPLLISENTFATHISISYIDGTYRKIFYANNLTDSGTMSAYANSIDTNSSSDSCIAEGTLITLSNGTQKAVEELTGNEMLLVWNMYTGTFDSAPILCIDSDPIGHYQSIKLSFSDGTMVDVLSEHGFWDVDLNKYVYLDEYAASYIGHNFLKQGENGMIEVTLINVEVSTEVTVAYSPVTYGHLCYFVNGMLSMPGGIDGLFNIFDVDRETMMYDPETMAADIEKYGLYTYEELNAIVPVPEIMFDAVNGQYLKVAVGKGLIDYETLGELIERYSEFFE